MLFGGGRQKQKQKQKQKQEEIMLPEADLIEEAVAEVESMDRNGAYQKVPELLGSIDQDYFQLGLALSHIKAHPSWWGSNQTFAECVEQRFGIKHNKALYLIKIADNLVESEVPWEKVESVGWSKLKEIASILTLKNVDEWVKLAESNTILQVRELVRTYKRTKLSPSELSEGLNPVSVLSFKVYEDQKEQIVEAIDQAKKKGHTTVASVALEYICTSYMAGTTDGVKLVILDGNFEDKESKPVLKTVMLKTVMKKLGAIEVLETFGDVFPDVHVSAKV